MYNSVNWNWYSAWGHLPNAAHVDRVLQSVKAHPEVWDRVPKRSAARDAACYAAQKAAEDAGRAEALRRADRHWLCPYRHAAPRDAIMALIAYDDAAKYLDMTPDRLKTWAVLSEEPAAVLLLPVVIAFEKLSELETA